MEHTLIWREKWENIQEAKHDFLKFNTIIKKVVYSL